MAKPVVYGPAYSSDARTVRLALEEKGIDYDLVEVNLLQGQAQTPEHFARHPFGKPAFEHDGFALSETDAIACDIDETFPGSDLVLADVRRRARMAQAMSVTGGYADPPMVTAIFIQRAMMPMMGDPSDDGAIAAALPQADTCLKALEQLIDGNRCLAGKTLSLANLLRAPIYDDVPQPPEGEKLLQGTPNLSRWWDDIPTRPTVEKTRPALG